MQNSNGLVDPATGVLGRKLLWRRGNCELWYGSVEGERRPGNVHYFVCEPGVRPASFEGLRDAWFYFRKLTDNSLSGPDPRGRRKQQLRHPEQPPSL